MVGTTHFGDSLVTRVRQLGHPLCLGIDPHVQRIPTVFGDATSSDPAQAASAVERFCLAAVERAAGRIAIIKPQSAFFEQLGHAGLAALERVVRAARSHGLLVLLDVKRGDIGTTAYAYAQSFMTPHCPTPSDAITVNPYLGLDSLTPFLEEAMLQGTGVFVLVKTSNPGSSDYQELDLVQGGKLYERVASDVARLGEPLMGECGWSSIGAVVGATYPEQSLKIRQLMPSGIFLVPGYGAQGAAAADAIRGFVPGPNGLEGGIVNSSRAILFPHSAVDVSATKWESLFDAQLARSIDELGTAVQR